MDKISWSIASHSTNCSLVTRPPQFHALMARGLSHFYACQVKASRPFRPLPLYQCVFSFASAERCKQLPEKPKDGLVIAPRTEHGMRALYQCQDGYMLIGSNVTTCNYGRWTSPVPVCQECKCIDLPLFNSRLIRGCDSRD